jgi:hypothetical protein
MSARMICRQVLAALLSATNRYFLAADQ